MTVRRKIITGLLVTALCCGTAMAAPGDIYLSVNAMNVDGTDQTNDINSTLDAQGLNARITGYDDTRHGWSINGYWQMAPRWGVEAGYVDLGNVNMKFQGVTADVDSFIASVSDLHPATANGATLALVGQHAFARRFTLQLKGGVFFWRSDYDLSGGTVIRHVNKYGTGGTYGIQLATRVARRFQAGLGVQMYTVEGQRNRTVNLGLTYRFPGLGASWWEKVRGLWTE